MITEPKFNGISIVIPYYNDSWHIGKCLDSIAASRMYLSLEERQKIEVIVIDDYSPIPFTSPAIDLRCLVYRQEERKGSGAARNRGVAFSLRNHILFLDSDVILDTTYLPRVFQRLSNDSSIKVLQCPHAPKPAGVSPGLFQYYLAISGYLYSSRELLTRSKEPSNFHSGAVVVEKNFFLSLGGFSEVFNSSGGEEYEISAKLSRYPQGAIVYDESLVSFHHFDSMKQRLRKLWRRSQFYLSTVGNISKLPLSFKIKSAERLLFACAMTLSLCTLFFKFPFAIEIYILLYILYAVADNVFTRYMICFHSYKLGFLSPLYRQLEYTTIGAGMCLGVVRRLIRISFNKYKFLFSPYPSYFIFWVTQNCNFKCRHCFNYEENERQNNDLSLDEIRKIALNSGHIKYLTISGGEPFMRRDLSEITYIFYRFNKLQILNVVTNGWFQDRIIAFVNSVLSSCPELYLNIAISIDGMKECHDRIRQQRGSFDRAMASAKILKQLSENRGENRLSVVVNSTYNQENADDLSKLSEFLSKEHGIPLYVGLIRTDNVLENKLLNINIDNFREVCHRTHRNIERNLPFHYPFLKIRLGLEAVVQDNIYNSAKHNIMTASCKAGKKGFVLTAGGDILLCEILNIRLGNVREYGYAPYRILDSFRAKQEMKKIINSRCHCTWECFQRLNVVYSPHLYPQVLWKVLKSMLHRGLVFR